MMNIYKLKDICTIKSGKRIPLGMDFSTTKTDYPYIRARDIKGGKIQTEDLIYIDFDVYNKIKKYIINENDIAITIVGASIGDVSYAQKEVDGYNLTENAIRLTNFNTSIVNSKFLFYLISQFQYHEYMQTIAGGAAQPKLGIYKIEKIKVQLPLAETQQKIANILSRYDEAIENNSKRVKLLEQMAQNLYKEWFVRFRFPGWQNAEFENGMPKGWKVDKLGNLFKRLPFGKTYKKEDLEENGKIIVIDQSTDDYLGFHNEEPSHKASFDSPLILFGDHSCKFVLMTKNFSLGENIIPISSCNINPYYLFRAIDGIIETTEYKRHWSMLITQKILIPTDSLQTRFSKIYKSFIKQIENLKSANQNLAKQRDLLLPRLMSGKLEV